MARRDIGLEIVQKAAEEEEEVAEEEGADLRPALDHHQGGATVEGAADVPAPDQKTALARGPRNPERAGSPERAENPGSLESPGNPESPESPERLVIVPHHQCEIGTLLLSHPYASVIL